jgi:hypothetical protein
MAYYYGGAREEWGEGPGGHDILKGDPSLASPYKFLGYFLHVPPRGGSCGLFRSSPTNPSIRVIEQSCSNRNGDVD